MKIRLIYCFLVLMISHHVLASDVPTNVTLTATETSVKVDWSGDTIAKSAGEKQPEFLPR